MSNHYFCKKKKIGDPKLGVMGVSQTQHEVFCHFFEFESYIFLEIEFDDSLQQYLT